MNESNEAWYEAMKLKGHKPKMSTWEGEEDEIDMWVVDEGFHNGPACETCHWSCCEHCESIDSIPECTTMTLEARPVQKKLT